MGRQGAIGPEGVAPPEPDALIEGQGFMLKHAGFKPQDAEPGRPGLVFQPRDQRRRHAPPARFAPGVHTLEFGKILEQGDAAAADRPAIQPRQIEADIVPKQPIDRQRVALEGYPGLLARELIGARSYKADDVARQTAERLIARKDMLAALEQGRTRLGLRLKLSPAQHERLVEDASGDSLDAVLCLMQAAWASEQPGYGLPADVDPLEGWIVSA